MSTRGGLACACALASTAVLGGCRGVQTMLDPIGDQARHIDIIWRAMLWVCGAMYVLVLLGLAWALFRALFVTSMTSGALGAFMALSQSPWYAPYAALGLAAFGLSPSQDQQLAGALMWVPGGLLHAAVAIALVAPQLQAATSREAADA